MVATCAAAAGGKTTIVDIMPLNSIPSTTRYHDGSNVLYFSVFQTSQVKFVVIRESIISYDSAAVEHYLSVPSQPNRVTITDSSVLTNFSMEPAPPQGLSIDAATGTITGTALVSFAEEFTVFTVTANRMDTTPVSTDIYMKASNFSFSYDAEGVLYLELGESFNLGPTTTPASINAQYSIEGVNMLPTGISLDASTGRLSGSSSEAFAATEFRIEAKLLANTDCTSFTTVTIGARINAPSGVFFSPAFVLSGQTLFKNVPMPERRVSVTGVVSTAQVSPGTSTEIRFDDQ